ncbi:tRNA pseudouridine(55) synthase TruB [Alloscardovia omnicolens]|uniref:tRNA pseudouridine(55) synthase TruB n=1 Tax=Alloscardovia omnicolens TaxID=419015 RepID=UPI003A76B53A
MLSSGVLIVDKPQGVTSHDVVAACRSLLHTSKVGHAGTLDPMATGVLIIGFGSATRLLNSIVGTDKTYITTIRLGLRSTTDDADGELIYPSESDKELVQERLAALTRESIEDVIAQHCVGDIDQIPSTFSAKKIHGQRAYDLARKGEDVQLKAQRIRVDEFVVTDMRRTSEGFIDVDARVTCSAGTYIRALGRDVGEFLGVGGYLTMLRRVRVGNFSADDSMALAFSAEERVFTTRDGVEQRRMKAVYPDDVRNNEQELNKHIISPFQAAAATLPMIELSDEQAIDISFGRPLELSITHPIAASYKTHLMALLEPWKKRVCKPSTVFITSRDLAALIQES